MARIAAPLTDSRIRQAQPADKPVKLADGGGMYLLLRPDGSRYWRLDYRFDGKRKTLALGVYPEVSLGEARMQRRAAKALLAEGRDPGVARKAEKNGHKPRAGGDEPAHALARVMRQRNLFLQTSAVVNEMIMTEQSEQAMMMRICQELTRDDLFRMAWIGLVGEDGVTVRPVAEAGFVGDYLAQVDVRCDDSPQGRGPTGTAIRMGATVVNNDTEINQRFALWRERARAQGYRSSAVTPLRVSGKVVGALNVYSPEPHAFGLEKVMLLEKLATDLGLAIGYRASLAALRESEERFRLICSVTTDLLYSCVQTEAGFFNVDWATASVDRIFGYSLDEILERGCWRCYVHPDDLPEFDRNITKLAPGQRSECELRILAKDGATRHIRAYSMVVEAQDGQHRHRLYGACQDITERKQAEERIEFMAHHDALTGLPNRILLRDRFAHALAMAARSQSRVALLFIDLDNFKRVNDTLGHAAGDQLLLEVVERLSRCTRESDTICRQGGDEFILLLNDIPDLETVERIARSILSHLAEPVEINGQVLNTSCSIGVAIFPEDGSDFDSLLQKADTAMYNAKDTGRNMYRFFDAQMNRQAHENLLLQNRLHQALSRGEFSLHYQPQLDIDSGRVVGVEALLRWQSPELGEVVPARFIPVAEDSGLIVPLGAWVLDEACRQAQAWRQAGWADLSMSVNLSALQFRRAGLIETVAGALDRSGLPPHLLELELTESILLQDVENNLESVRQLKALGVRLSIDDFGTGYSSLSYLKRFAVDRLKIDRSFVRDVNLDPDNAAIVCAVIQLARSLRLGIIAEGVETQEQLAFLREEGCPEVQGFLYSRPLAPANLETFLREHMAVCRA